MSDQRPDTPRRLRAWWTRRKAAGTGGPIMSPGTYEGTEVIRVFILDDHDMIRRGLRDFLDEAGGFEVVGESGSAREAVRRIPALRPHVALLDVQLPDGSGVEVCQQVRQLDPSIRTLMVTSYDDDDARLAAMMAG